MKNIYAFFGGGFVAGAIYFFYKAYDRMVNYENPEDAISMDELVNSHVGGDAYNYIINGTHATVFAVIAIGLMLAALMCFLFQAYVNRNTDIVPELEDDYVNPNPEAEAFVQEYRQRNQEQEQSFKRSDKDR